MFEYFQILVAQHVVAGQVSAYFSQTVRMRRRKGQRGSPASRRRHSHISAPRSLQRRRGAKRKQYLSVSRIADGDGRHSRSIRMERSKQLEQPANFDSRYRRVRSVWLLYGDARLSESGSLSDLYERSGSRSENSSN